MNKGSQEEQGSVEIANSVVATLAAKAAKEVEGVVALAQGVRTELAKLIGREGSSGVRVREEGEREVSLELHVVAAYKISLPSLSQKLSERVRREVEGLTETKVKTVEVFVEDVLLLRGSEKE